MSKVFATPVGRRAMLALGVQGVMGLCTALGIGTAMSLFGSLTGCYRAPGTARDQVIFFSEEKELQLGLDAFRQVLRAAPLSDNVEVNELVHRVGRNIAHCNGQGKHCRTFHNGDVLEFAPAAREISRRLLLQDACRGDC